MLLTGRGGVRGKHASVPLVVLIFLSSGRAAAQEAPMERQFELGVTARLLYDSNLLRLPPGQPERPGQSASDLRFTPALSLDIRLPVGRQSLFLEASVGKDVHQHNTQLDSARLKAAAGTDLVVGSICTGTLRSDYGRNQSELADVLDKSELRNIETRLAFDTRMNCGRPLGLRGGAEYSHRRVTNSEERFFNVEESEYTIRVSYARPTFGDLSLFGNYRSAAPIDQLSVRGGANAFEVYSGGVRFDREIGSRLGGVAEIRYFRLKPQRTEVSSFSGLSWSINLNWRPIERLSSRILLSRQAEQSNLLDISYSITTRTRIDAEYVVSRKLRLVASMGVARRQLRPSDAPGEALAGIEQKLYDTTIGARLNARKNLYFTVEARHERRTGDDPLLNFRSKGVLVGLGSTI